MSHSVSVKNIEGIINPVTITNWYQAKSLSLNHGDLVNSFTDNSGNDVHLLQTNDASKPTFEIDSQGFKCVRFYSGDAMTSTISKPYNIDETFIAICQVNVNPGGNRFTLRQFGGFNRVYLQNSAVVTEATDYLPGSGKYFLSLPTVFVAEDKVAIVVQRRASVNPIFKVWDKKKYGTGTFSNISYAAAGTWNISSNTTWEVSVYEMLVVSEFLSEEVIHKLVRTMGFKNGLRI